MSTLENSPASRIMIIDDISANVAVLDGMLRAIGHEDILGLTDVHTALQRFEGYEPDLVLVDLHMPSMDGCEVMAALRDRLPEGAFLPIMMITADASDEAKERAFVAGANDFLTKPFGFTECSLRVRNLLELKHMHRTLDRQNSMLSTRLHETQELDRETLAHRIEMGRRIDQVISDNGMFMAFQPIVSVGDSSLVGVEALARFHQVPIMPPDEWFRGAAEAGRGVELELRAVELAMRELTTLPEDAFMAVNLSPVAARSPRLAGLITEPHRIVIELTEHERVEDYGPLRDALNPLRRAGARVACDDAGSGFAGLDRLVRLEPDIIKLDRGLVSDVHLDRVKQGLIAALVAFCESIGAKLVAQGIENAEELVALRALGADHAQGFHIARPSSLEQAIAARAAELVG